MDKHYHIWRLSMSGTAWFFTRSWRRPGVQANVGNQFAKSDAAPGPRWAYKLAAPGQGRCSTMALTCMRHPPGPLPPRSSNPDFRFHLCPRANGNILRERGKSPLRARCEILRCVHPAVDIDADTQLVRRHTQYVRPVSRTVHPPIHQLTGHLLGHIFP